MESADSGRTWTDRDEHQRSHSTVMSLFVPLWGWARSSKSTLISGCSESRLEERSAPRRARFCFSVAFMRRPGITLCPEKNVRRRRQSSGSMLISRPLIVHLRCSSKNRKYILKFHIIVMSHVRFHFPIKDQKTR